MSDWSIARKDRIGNMAGRLLCTTSLSALVLLALPSIAQAQDANRNWDANGTAVNNGGTGTWNTTTSTWSPNTDGISGPYLPWNNTLIDNAIFGGNAGTVTLGTPITVHNITFDTANYTLTGNTLTLAGTTPTITVNSGTSTINSIIAGTAGLTKAGAGGLTLGGNNSFTGGVTVDAGTLTLSGANGFAGNVNVNAGTLNLSGSNTFTGAINVNAGTLNAASNASLGDSTNIVNVTGGATLRATGLLTGRVVNLTSGQTISYSGSAAAHFTGVGGLYVGSCSSCGVVVELSDTTNDFTGQVKLAANNATGVSFRSVRDIGQASSLGAGTSAIILEGNTTTSAFNYTGTGDSSNRDWQMTTSGGSPTVVLRNSGSGTLTLTGNISAIGSINSVFQASSADLQLLGVLSGSAGAFRFLGSSTNTITLGTANIFTGSASVENGVVKVGKLADGGASSSLGAGTSISVLSGGTLSYTGAAASSDRTLSITNGTLNNDSLTGGLVLSGATSLAGSLTLGGSFTGADNTLSGIISGTGNLISSGPATWVLSGANTRTGTTTVNGGTLRGTNASSFGTVSGLTVSGGTLDTGGFNLATPTLAGTGTIALGAGTLSVAAATAQTFGGSISGSGGLTKLGSGMLTLTGTNSYTGATTINNGTVRLNFSAAGAPASNILANSSTVSMAGGTLNFLGKAGTANSQTFGGLTITGGNNTISATSGTGGSIGVNFGAITRTNGLVNFVLPSSGSFTTSNVALGPWATVNGSDYADVVGGNIVAFTGYANKDNASTWANGDIVSDQGGAANTPYSGTLASDVALGGIKYTAAANSLVDLGGHTLSTDGSIIVAPTVGNATQTISNGNLTGGAGGGTLGVQQNSIGNGSFNIAATIVDNGGATGFAKAGAGLITLSGANSYTGATTVSQGTLSVNSIADGGAASAIGASTNAASNLVIQGATLRYTGASATSDRGFTIETNGPIAASAIDVTQAGTNLTFGGLVTSPDDVGLTKTGAGTLTLAGAVNDYTGVTTVSGGTLAASTLANGGLVSSIGASSAASSNLVLQGGGELEYIGGTIGIDRGFTLGAGGGAIDVATAATTLTMAGTVAGTGTLSKNGAGTLVLSASNVGFTAGGFVNAGTLRAGSTTRAFGSGGWTVASGATLDLNGFSNTINVITGGGTVTLGTATLTVNNASAAFPFSGVISGSGGLALTGGTQVMLGCGNAYTGATTITGTLSVDCLANGGSPSGIGASGTASTNLVFNNGVLNYTGTTVTTNRGFQLLSTGAIDVQNAGTTLTFTGVATGGGLFRKDGAGTLILSGANTLTGPTSITGGVLRVGSATALGPSSMSLSNVAGAALDLNNFNSTFIFLLGGGTLGGDIALGSGNLTLNYGGNTTQNYGGAISGTGGLVKGGAATFVQTLSGCNSSYDGTTTINSGVLAVNCLGDGGVASSIGDSGAVASNLVLSGGTLRYTGTGSSTNRLFTLGASATSKIESSGTGALSFANTGAIAFSSPDTAQTIRLGGTNTGNNSFGLQITNNNAGLTSFTKEDAGTWILTNQSSTYTGVTRIIGGVLGVDKLSDAGFASSIGQSSIGASNLVIGEGSTLRYTGTGDSTNRLFTLDKGVSFIESSGTGAIAFTNTGAVAYADAGQTRVVALGGTNTGNNIMGASIGNSGAGVTTLAKNDAGTWYLTGDSTYTGPTNVNGGILYIGNGGTSGSIQSTTANVAGGSTLGFDRSDAVTFAGTIAGAGAVQQLGTGTTTLTGTNSYTGGTTISAGTLQLGSGAGGGATGSIVGNVANSGTLAFNRNNTYIFAGTVSGTGALNQIGTGTTVLTAANTYTGGTTISQGILQVGNSGTTGSIVGDVLSTGGLLSFRRSDTVTYAGNYSGTGGLTMTGGTLILTGNNSYSGDTVVATNSRIQVGNGGTTGAIAGNVKLGPLASTIAFNRSDSLVYAGVISGASGTSVVRQAGTGTTVFTGTNTYAGVTNVDAGTLLINGDQSGATGLTSVASGATLGGTGMIGGNVTIADGGALAAGSNGVGTLAVNGNLLLGNTSQLNFEFGQANVAGGPLNDLVNVGGNLTLDGVVNVTQTAGGTFGPGVYRIFNYSGLLTNNGATVGVLPGGGAGFVQTAVANQVNLVNTAGLTLNIWDGAAGPKNDGAIQGGNGIWRIGGAANDWTDVDGAVNVDYVQDSFAIFQGTAGTVTVDNVGGNVLAAGMQFTTNGYVIAGGPLTLTGAQARVRVGDGTPADAGITTTINAALTGSAQLVKDLGGTLVLTGANSYTGGTAINGGTLSVASDANLGGAAGALSFDGGILRWTGGSYSPTRAINWGANGGGFDITNSASVVTVNQTIVGGGPLIKRGAGRLVLNGANSYSGGTTIEGGTLQVAGSIIGDVLNNGVLAFSSPISSTFGGSVTGTGSVYSIGAGTTTLTGNSNYDGTTNVSGGGEIQIASGAVVSSGGGSLLNGGRLTVDGVGSTFNVTSILAQSVSGQAATVNVQNGGVLRMTGFLTLRNSPTNVVLASLNVSGPGSLADIGGAVTVGTSGNTNIAGVNISAGGRLRTGAASQMGAAIGNTTAPFVTITGVGSDWTSSNALTITNGQFSLLNGGTASFTDVTAGTVSAARPADIMVSGPGSQLTASGDLVIGSGAGTGALTLTDGGRVIVGGAFLLGDNAAATGILNIGGGEGQAAAATGVFDAATLNLGSATSRTNFNHTDPAYSFATVISGSGVVNQVAGTTILTGGNSYTSTTNVNGGTLLVNGDQTAATGATIVATGGTLGGIGIIGGNASVADGATLAPGDVTGPGTLTINGNLVLAGTSRLDYSFGQSNLVGGPLNDHTQVGGDLTLDGTIDVTLTPGGSFGPGLYRVISYGGALNDQGLSLGILPPGSLVAVQTSIAGQVNLINTSGAALNFWDGAALDYKGDGTVNGGNGLWQNSTGNDNWTETSGAVNGAYTDASFAIFAATSGTVSIDNSLGAVSASGMQFASDGYRITGQDLMLVGPQSTVRVGDGTAAGAGFTATIDAVLIGATQLVKADFGTLVLAGTNSYSGGTRMDAGTLRITADANLGDTAGGLTFGGGTLHTTADLASGRIVDLVATGTLLTDAGTMLTLNGAISGAGGLTKTGAGSLILAGTNSFAGDMAINDGSLFVNGNQTGATGMINVASGALLGGSGIIGGNVTIADGAMLAAGTNAVGTLTINGNLALSSGSVLNYEFGAANVAGGSLNDLVNVGGDLVLDGTINVTVPAGGSFGPGIYRAFNYGGALTDNGLTLGTLPGGSAVSVQTAIAGQINLVNTAGLTLSFWDGNAGPKNDGTVNGGNGAWRVTGGTNNWTDATGSLNADYAQDSFAIFSAAPGIVTIDDIGGNVRASGMQFASDGYTVTGDALTLTGSQAIVQVGDSSAASVGYTATIASELTGTAGLVKTDAGTLVLTAANSYTGGTTVDGGTLQIGNGGTTGSITGDIDNNGVLVLDRSDAIALDGTISGTGSLTKRGGGILTLTGTNSYGGGTLVDAGTVQISSDANLGDVAGTLSLQGGTLQAGASFTSGRTILLGSSDSNDIDTQAFDVTLGGTIGDGPNNSAGNFVNKLGSGTLTLTGANTYNNRTVIAGGTLALAGAGTIGAGNLVVNTGTVFDISQADVGARVIQLNSGPAGTIALGSKILTLGFGNSSSDWSGTIADGGIGGGTGGSVVIAAPNGVVRFFEANSYTGGTTVAAGTFELSGNGSLFSGGAVTVNAGTTFAISGLAGAGTTIGDFSGAGTAALGAKALTFGTANDTSFSGTITGSGGALVKNGTGVFTLSGANSYTGATSVNAGTLLVNGNQSAATGLTSIASGATLGGTGTIGGDVVVADGATLAPGTGGAGALTINGRLSLGAGSSLAYEFGRANAPGDPLNDVVNVGGDLTLDGTLNVAVTPGGAFDIGLYRIANYGGTLTDNGLALGTLPAGADVFVQSSVAGQVNLINVGGATLNFWDGAAGPKFNGAINGGDGTWQNSSGNDNWADATGAVNAGYNDGAFAIFTGAAGTVTIDDSLGAVTASGLQFATNGYTITGDALALTGPQSVIRVGDGTVGGAGYTATIASVITSSTQLVKTDLGTLVLTGANTYTGGTAINGGTVRVASDASLGAAAGGLSLNGGTLNTTADLSSARAVALTGAGTFLTDVGTTLTLGGPVTGAGSLTKSGTGTLVLSGTGSHGGATNVGAGTLLVNGNYAGATGGVSIASGATLGGTGTIGGDVTFADGSTLTPGAGGAGTLTINGDLSLAAGTTLAYEFGAANVAGGALNDLVNVGGDLVLDGVINVTVPAGGAFDVGVYRVFNYGGTLTNNGLGLGALPAGSDVDVQTSIAGQVNLVNSAGLTLNFWDGAAGPKNNGAINGGNGTWQAGTGNDNWTNANGTVNAAYSDGAFAVFGGAGGTVTVDNGLGQVTAVGMQFAANGYTITGGPIALTGPQSVIRVGDGSTAGAGFTAMINSVLSGATQLVKTDAGTLILGGTNSYSGGTLINGGAVQIAADANLGAAAGDVTLDGGTLATSANITSARDIVMAGAGTIAAASGTTFTVGGLLSGTGALTNRGAGTLLLTGDSSGFAGSTQVEGIMVVNGSLCGDVHVAAGGRLGGTGTICTTVNNGTIAPGNSIGTLTIAGSYTGNNGVLEIEAELGGDASPTDRLVVTNGTSGTTRVDVINRGGLGAQTIEGIKIVDVTGGTSAGTFALNGDYVFQGEQAVIAGAYGYRLYQGGTSTPTDGDWYLRSALLNAANEPQAPLYQPGVPVYEAYGQTLFALTDMGTLHQRVGNRQWAETEGGKPSGLWGRMQSNRSRQNAVSSTSLSDVNVDSWKIEMGADHVLSQRSDGASLVLGVLGSYGDASANIASIYGNGSIETKGYSAGTTLTWFGPQGFYVDGRAQFTWFDSKLKSAVLGTLADGNDGTGQAYSLEVGKRTQLGGTLAVTPQVQAVYTKVKFDRFTDPNDAVVSSDRGDSLKTRWGISIDRLDAKSHLYGVANLSYEWLDGTVTDVSGTPIARQNHRLWGELGIGGSLLIGDRLTLYTEVSADAAINDFAKSYSLKGTAGLRLSF